MDAKALLVTQLESGEWTLLKACEDLDDHGFLARLPNAGESADWIFGHIAVNEDWFLATLTGADLALSQQLHAVYQADFPDPTVRQGILPRNALLALFMEQRRRTLAAVASADPTHWGEPPPAGLPDIFASEGAVWGVLGTHQYWHLGQLMSIRSMTGLPVFEFGPHASGARAMPTEAKAAASVQLTLPTDGPRVRPREMDEVSPYVRAEFDKAMETWGIHNHLIRTMGAHPQLALTEVDYANAFIFQERMYSTIPTPGEPKSGALMLFPAAGFIDRVTKELVISLVSLKNRSRYSITHHTVIGFGALATLAAGATPAAKVRRAEALLLGLVDASGHETFRTQTFDGDSLYSALQIAALELASRMNLDAHLVSDEQIIRLRELLGQDAREQLTRGPLASQFESDGPDDSYVDAFVDGALVELTWCIAHFSGLLNRWFTVLKVRDEEFAVDASGATFIDVYNSVVPDSIKARNNGLLGNDGWGGGEGTIN